MERKEDMGLPAKSILKSNAVKKRSNYYKSFRPEIQKIKRVQEEVERFKRIKQKRESRKQQASFAKTYKEVLEFERLKEEKIKVSGYRRKDGTYVRPSRRKDEVLGGFLPPVVQKAVQINTSSNAATATANQAVIGAARGLAASGRSLAASGLGVETNETGELPSRKRVAGASLRQTGNFLMDTIRNPKRAIERGRERERAMLAAISKQAGEEVTKGDVIKAGMGHAVDEIKSLDPKAVQGVVEDTGANIAGAIISPLGAAAGPLGVLGVGYAAEIGGKKGIRDAYATKEAYDQLKGTEEFDQKGRIGQFKEVMGTARQLVNQRSAERKAGGEDKQEFAGDNAGFIAGNAAAALPIPIPFKGAIAGIPASIVGESWEEQRQNGLNPLQAAHKITVGKIKEGNAREQKVRDEFKKRFPSMKQIASRIVKDKLPQGVDDGQESDTLATTQEPKDETSST